MAERGRATRKDWSSGAAVDERELARRKAVGTYGWLSEEVKRQGRNNRRGSGRGQGVKAAGPREAPVSHPRGTSAERFGLSSGLPIWSDPFPQPERIGAYQEQGGRARESRSPSLGFSGGEDHQGLRRGSRERPTTQNVRGGLRGGNWSSRGMGFSGYDVGARRHGYYGDRPTAAEEVQDRGKEVSGRDGEGRRVEAWEGSGNAPVRDLDGSWAREHEARRAEHFQVLRNVTRGHWSNRRGGRSMYSDDRECVGSNGAGSSVGQTRRGSGGSGFMGSGSGSQVQAGGADRGSWKQGANVRARGPVREAPSKKENQRRYDPDVDLGTAGTRGQGHGQGQGSTDSYGNNGLGRSGDSLHRSPQKVMAARLSVAAQLRDTVRQDVGWEHSACNSDMISGLAVRPTSEVKPRPVKGDMKKRVVERTAGDVVREVPAGNDVERGLGRPGRNRSGDLVSADGEVLPSIVGSCPDMCPAKEREMRERLKDLAVFERVSGQLGRTSQALAVKKFCRTLSSADLKPSDVRPLPVLRLTVDYLWSLLDRKDSGFKLVHDFLFDRCRGVRQDLSMQQIVNRQAISICEEIVRFHIISERELHEQSLSKKYFNSELNLQQLGKTLLSLLSMYAACDQRVESEAEFQAYFLLSNLGSVGKGQAESLTLWLPTVHPSLLNRPEMVFARSVLKSYRMGNFMAFFQLVQEASYLQACLLELVFNQVRAHALHVLNQSSYKLHPYPLSDLAKLLLMEEEDVKTLCTFYGLSVGTENSTGVQCLLVKQAQFAVQPEAAPWYHCRHVEAKRPSCYSAAILSSAEG